MHDTITAREARLMHNMLIRQQYFGKPRRIMAGEDRVCHFLWLPFPREIKAKNGDSILQPLQMSDGQRHGFAPRNPFCYGPTDVGEGTLFATIPTMYSAFSTEQCAEAGIGSSGAEGVVESLCVEALRIDSEKDEASRLWSSNTAESKAKITKAVKILKGAHNLGNACTEKMRSLATARNSDTFTAYLKAINISTPPSSAAKVALQDCFFLVRIRHSTKLN